MPILTVEPDAAADAARLAERCLVADQRALNNMFRLMTGFRSHGYYSMLTDRVPIMVSAITAALNDLYPGQQADEAAPMC